MVVITMVLVNILVGPSRLFFSNMTASSILDVLVLLVTIIARQGDEDDINCCLSIILAFQR